MPAFLFWASCSYAMCFCDFISINYISAPYSPISVSTLKSQMAEQIQNLPVADFIFWSSQTFPPWLMTMMTVFWLFWYSSWCQCSLEWVWDYERRRQLINWSRRGWCWHTWEWRQMVSFQGNMKIYRANHLWGKILDFSLRFSSKFVLGPPDFLLLESRVFSFASVA